MRRLLIIGTAALVLVPLLAGCGGGGRAASFGEHLSAATVVNRLAATGLPIGKMEVYNATTDPNHLLGRPGEYTSKVNFRDTRIKNPSDPTDPSAGGSVEVFKSAGDAKKRADYFRAIAAGSPILGEYNYLRGRVWLRVSLDLTPREAKQYERALQRL